MADVYLGIAIADAKYADRHGGGYRIRYHMKATSLGGLFLGWADDGTSTLSEFIFPCETPSSRSNSPHYLSSLLHFGAGTAMIRGMPDHWS